MLDNLIGSGSHNALLQVKYSIKVRHICRRPGGVTVGDERIN